MVRQPNLQRVFALLTVVVFTIVGFGCGDKEDDIGREESGTISVQPSRVTFSGVLLGETETRTLTIENTGDNDLRVFEMEFKAKEGQSIDYLSVEEGPTEGFTLAPDEQKEVEFEYAPEEAGAATAGVLEIFSSDPTYSQEEPLEVDVLTLGNAPRINVSPPVVRYPRLPPGQKMTREVVISNVGDAPLEVYDLSVSGSEDFRIQNVDKSLPETIEVSSAEQLESEEAREIRVEVEYAPTADGSSTAELVIESNEEPGATAEDPSVKRVEMNANADSACLLIDGTARNLGAVPLGDTRTEAITVENCGSEPLEIEQVEFADDSGPYTLNLGSHDGNDDGTLDEPIVVEDRGDTASLTVDYAPEEEGTHRATLVLHSNDPAQPKAEIELIAKGAEGECPEVDVVAKPDTAGGAWRTSVTAAPLDYVLLDASESEDPDGRIVDYNWTVEEKPEGTQVNFGPWEDDTADSDQSKRRFRLLTAGNYQIGLTLEDNDGFRSCEEGLITVTAIPDEKVHVELTWTNPEDPDETDEEGSDVDLHLVKMGPGEWFEEPYDVYYKNPNNGGDGSGSGIWNPENPSLDIDDTDGAGPENIQMNNPQECQWYAIGVHYFRQRFGTAYATVRVYINERLVFEKLNKPLVEGKQFWDVARIHWPSGQVYSAGSIQPEPPIGDQPEITDGMKESGLCTAEDLYSTQ